jgi:hypothetical protein
MHRQRQAAQVLAVECKNIESVELHFVICFRECSAPKSEIPSTPSTTASPSITKCLMWFFSADWTIQG